MLSACTQCSHYTQAAGLSDLFSNYWSAPRSRSFKRARLGSNDLEPQRVSGQPEEVSSPLIPSQPVATVRSATASEVDESPVVNGRSRASSVQVHPVAFAACRLKQTAADLQLWSACRGGSCCLVTLPLYAQQQSQCSHFIVIVMRTEDTGGWLSSSLCTICQHKRCSASS